MLDNNKLKQATNWSCLPTALAILLGKEPQEVIDGIGHDGSEIVFPEEPEPRCRRSFTYDDVAWYLLKYNLGCLIPFKRKQIFAGNDELTSFVEINYPNFNTVLDGCFCGILLGRYKDAIMHAVALKSTERKGFIIKEICDPSWGYWVSYEHYLKNYVIDEYWILKRD